MGLPFPSRPFTRVVLLVVASVALLALTVAALLLTSGTRYLYYGSDLVLAIGPTGGPFHRLDVEPARERPSEPGPELELRLSGEGHSVADLVEVVRAQARQVPGADADAPVTVILSGDVARDADDDRELLAGRQQGREAWIRSDLVGAELTLLHEVAHVLTDGDGHGERWRAVYLGAVDELYGERRRSREERRIAWVHDRCYLDDRCPRPAATASEEVPRITGVQP